jgi:hypothetical protein
MKAPDHTNAKRTEERPCHIKVFALSGPRGGF